MQLDEISKNLSRELENLSFSPAISHVYNPLEYAFAPHQAYLKRYASVAVKTVLLGMNPGPWGMAQTGVPFGEVSMVRDWLGIEAPVGKPRREHPKRPIEGFACQRSEVSGARLWGWAKTRYQTPEAFFRRFFIINYCPLAFMTETARNITPDKLSRGERAQLFELCDRALVDMIAWLKPEAVVGVGKFAEARAREALSSFGLCIGNILHPSPASPAANRGWAAEAEKQLGRLELL